MRAKIDNLVVGLVLLILYFNGKGADVSPATVVDSHHPLTLPKDESPLKYTSSWEELIFTK